MCGAQICGAQICGASIFPLLNTNVPSIVVPICVVPKCVVPVGAPVAMWCQLEPVISSDFPEISQDLGNSRDLMTSQRSKGQGQGQGRLI